MERCPLTLAGFMGMDEGLLAALKRGVSAMGEGMLPLIKETPPIRLHDRRPLPD